MLIHRGEAMSCHFSDRNLKPPGFILITDTSLIKSLIEKMSLFDISFHWNTHWHQLQRLNFLDQKFKLSGITAVTSTHTEQNIYCTKVTISWSIKSNKKESHNQDMSGFNFVFLCYKVTAFRFHLTDRNSNSTKKNLQYKN